MDARILVFFLLCVFFISGIGGKPPSESTRGSKKQEYQESQMVLLPLKVTTQRDTTPGNTPIVNPTVPGTSPIVNPTSPAPPTTTSPPTLGGAWCVAITTASQTALQVALDFACGYGGADCSAIQPNAACYDPDTVRDHASYAFNAYYQKNPISTSCDFGGTAQLTYTDPSHGNCRYAAPTSTPKTPTTTPPAPPTTTPTIPMTPPSTTTPANTYPLGGGNGYDTETGGYDYGAEPAGTPSSAGTVSLNLLLHTTMNCVILSAILTKNF